MLRAFGLPARAAGPAEVLAHRADDARRRLLDAGRFLQEPRDRVLDREAQLHLHGARDVLCRAAIAAEAPGRVEHRLAARAEVAQLAARIGQLEDEIAEGLVRVQRRAVSSPV